MLNKFLYVSMILLDNGISNANLRIKPLNNDWNDDSYLDQDYQVFNKTLRANKFTVSGFSSGAILTTNLFAMFNQYIDGIAVLAGIGPCATRQEDFTEMLDIPLDDQLDISICQEKSEHFPTDGYLGKPAYFYSGTKDKIVPHEFTKSSAEWHKEMGVNLKTNWIDEFEHVYPNDIPGHLYNNP